MAEIIQNESSGRKRRPTFKKHSTQIDMTPLVDLACLLLTFFMLTTAFTKPKVMDIVIPDKSGNSKIPEKRTVNIIVDKNKVYWYNGAAKNKDGTLQTLTATNIEKNDIRKMLLHRNKKLVQNIDVLKQNIESPTLLKERVLDLKRNDSIGPIVLIKATDKAKYGNIVDILDEMAICNIAKYSIADLLTEERTMLENIQKTR
jgi:biopolymer transport protein ExbD